MRQAPRFPSAFNPTGGSISIPRRSQSNLHLATNLSQTISSRPRNRRKAMPKINFDNSQLPRFAFATVIILMTTFGALAQTQITTGAIQGTVTDPNGAVVPGATIQVKNLDTNNSRTLTSDEAGRFATLALQPGPYSITVAKQGFATAVAER